MTVPMTTRATYEDESLRTRAPLLGNAWHGSQVMVGVAGAMRRVTVDLVP